MRNPFAELDYWLLERFGSYVRGAGYAALVSLLSLFAGLFGALYADDIKASFPFAIGFGPISGPAAVFWSLALLATFLFFLAQRASDIERQTSEARLDERSDDLTRLIRTMPPSDFLFAFRDIYQNCAGALNAAIAELNNRESIEKAIRIVCKGVAILAQRFDGASAHFVYAANVMHYRPISELDARDLKEIRARLRFVEPEMDISTLDGVLDLDPSLSTATRTDDQESDTELMPLALPVPHVRKTEDQKWRVLPGAPLAFCQEAIDGYGDTGTLGSWCREQGFSHGVAQEVEAYFRERSSTVRSFISLPIVRFDESAEVLGVLNIHRNQPNLLKEKQPAEQFEPLTVPFVAILVQLLDLLNKSRTEGVGSI